MNTRNVVIRTRLSESEAERFRAAAKRCGLSPSAFLRTAATGRVPKQAPPETFWAHMDVLYAVCNGLRDIAQAGGEDSEYAAHLQDTLVNEILRLQETATLPEKTG